MQELHIYFAGAIRGGRDDAELYAALIRHLSRYGKVLTEHVGNELLLGEEKFMSERDIFARDMQWLRQADLVIAEVSTPSLGVGYEIAVAQNLDLDVLCLHRASSSCDLSAMIAGNPGLRIARYADFAEAKEIIEQYIKSFLT